MIMGFTGVGSSYCFHFRIPCLWYKIYIYGTHGNYLDIRSLNFAVYSALLRNYFETTSCYFETTLLYLEIIQKNLGETSCKGVVECC